jgi:hypothetical protein
MSGTELIEAFGGHVEPILKLVTDLFLIHNFGPFIAGVLITIGFVILVTLVVRVGLAVLGTGRARGYLLAIASGQEFAQRFSAIDQHLRTNAAVSSSWRALAAGFSFPEPTRSGDGLIRSPVRPQQAFHPDEANLNLTYFRLWPNLFVGVGLLLTFAGLISALTVAVGGFAKEAATSKELQGSLGVLLTVSAAKFYSSLAALAVSLALTISIRLGQSVKSLTCSRDALAKAEAVKRVAFVTATLMGAAIPYARTARSRSSKGRSSIGMLGSARCLHCTSATFPLPMLRKTRSAPPSPVLGVGCTSSFKARA